MKEFPEKGRIPGKSNHFYGIFTILINFYHFQKSWKFQMAENCVNIQSVFGIVCLEPCRDMAVFQTLVFAV